MSALSRLLLACAVALAVTGCGSAVSSGSGDAAPAPAGQGSSAPAEPGGETLGAAPTATTLGGEEFDFATLEGTPTVLWFWAPWCTICRAEAPDVAAAAERLAGDVTVLGVPGRGERPDMQQFVADTGVDGLEHVVDEDGTIWSTFGVVSQPAFAFIDAEGQVEVFNGAMGGEALERTARTMLG